MRYLLTRESVAELERRSAAAGVAEDQLMQRAGAALAHHAKDMPVDGLVVVLCGIGNNAGDGWVAAQELHQAGYEVVVVSAGSSREEEGLAGDVRHQALEAGVSHIIDTDGTALENLLQNAVLVIDCMFGAGFHGQLRQPYVTWAQLVAEKSLPVLACDLPSGMEADTSQCSQYTLQADKTMVTIAVKIGMRTGKHHNLCGEILVEDLGVDTTVPGGIAALALAEEWDVADLAPLVPLPSYDTNKYTRGHVAVVAGSNTYVGAALLCGDAARRGGAGYATLCVPESLHSLAQAHLPAAVVKGFEECQGAFAHSAAGEVAQVIDGCQAFAAGPGLTITEGTEKLLQALCESNVPAVLDADGLSIVSKHPQWLAQRPCPGATVLTPHAGERRRLLAGIGIDVSREEHADIAQRIYHNQQLASELHVVLVDKGPETLVCNGQRAVLFANAPSALATSGSGDVLCGLIASLLATGRSPLEAACLGVALHGYAGAFAANALTAMCVTAEDVLKEVPHAVKLLIEE